MTRWLRDHFGPEGDFAAVGAVLVGLFIAVVLMPPVIWLLVPIVRWWWAFWL